MSNLFSSNVKLKLEEFSQAITRNDFRKIRLLVESIDPSDKKKICHATFDELKREVEQELTDKKLAHAVLILKRIKMNRKMTREVHDKDRIIS